jgi:tetratricopeptide (TPR) repeat protein
LIALSAVGGLLPTRLVWGVMFLRIVSFVAVLALTQTAAHARRVALVIGQNAYSGGTAASVGLPALGNPARDAGRMAKLLEQHGFEVIACDGKTPGCFDLDRVRLLGALKRLEQRAAGADLALVFFAGHGLASEEGNILAPVDANLNCSTGAVTNGVVVERIIKATEPARHKLVIIDACRDNPVGDVCPNLKGKKLSFTRIEAGAMRGFLLVTSTQFGQQALDGPPGIHSPFATALFSSFEASPSVYFEQVFNEVARATYEAAQKQRGFLQIPGRVVGGEAPADCLAGKGCIGDARMAALAVENERLAADAAGVRNLLAAEEQARGKLYTIEERQKRVAELQQTLTSIGTSTDPMRQEAHRLIDQGNVVGGQAKLDQALEADEKALAQVERAAVERRKVAAQSARDLAVLARGTDIIKAVSYYRRATRLDPADTLTWNAFAYAALDAGRTADAKAGFEQAASKGKDSKNPYPHFVSMLGLGDVAKAQGNLSEARKLYDLAAGIAEPIVKANPGNARWQRDLSVLRKKVGAVLVDQGNLPAALESYRAALAIAERLTKVDPGNAGWQFAVAGSRGEMGDVLRAQGDLPAALESYQATLAIFERLAKADPENSEWQYHLGVSNERVGEVLRVQGNLDNALKHYRARNEIISRLAKRDPGNARWQRDLSVSHYWIGEVLRTQGRLSAALESARASLAIAEHLAKSDPGNSGWQRDLSMSHHNIGDVLQDLGSLPAALESYRASLAIIERLAKADPGNTEWQRGLAISHGRVAMVLARQGDEGAATTAFERGRAITARLIQQSPDNATLPKDLAWYESQLVQLKRKRPLPAQD